MGTTPDAVSAAPCLALTKMETLVREMQSPESGVPVRGQKMFLTTIPSAFMGYDLIEWLMTNLPIEDAVEALHLASLLCQYGYFFPVGDAKTLQVKDDSSLYRFQTPYYWPSQNHVPDSTDYAIYIHKKMVKTKQKHVVEEYELEAYNQLKKTLASKWDFVVMQAEEQLKMAKDRKKGDKIVSESQERAYWRVYRPPPGFTNTLECKPVPDRGRPGKAVAPRQHTATSLAAELQYLQQCLLRSRSKVSQAAEGLITSHETYLEFDPLLSPVLPSNPWLSDDPTFLELNEPLVDCPTEWRVRRWAISMDEMIADPTGLQEITKCMKKEHSHENIRFWTAVHQLKKAPLGDVKDRVNCIYSEFLRPGAPCEINIDGRTMEKTQALMTNPSRFTFDSAADHIYELLLKKDCYPRFLRSEHYKNLLTNAINPTSKKRFFTFGATGKKKVSASAPASHSQGASIAGKHTGDDTVSLGQKQEEADNLRDTHAGIFLGGPSRPCTGSLPRLTLPSSPFATAVGPASAGPASAPAASAIPSPAFTSSLPPPPPPAPPSATVSAGGTSSSPPASCQTDPAQRPAVESRPDQVCETAASPACSSVSPLSPQGVVVTTAAPAPCALASPLCTAATGGAVTSAPRVTSEREPGLERVPATASVTLECNPEELKTVSDGSEPSSSSLLSSERLREMAGAASLATIAEAPEPAEAASSREPRRRPRLPGGTVSLEEDPRRPERADRKRRVSADCRRETRDEQLERQGSAKTTDEGQRSRRRSSGARRRRGQTAAEDGSRPSDEGGAAPAEVKSPEKAGEDAVCPWEHDLGNPTWV